MRIANHLLLNFAASYSEGGLKRLQAYAAWFDRHGGAAFVIHPRCADLKTLFPRNRYFVVDRSRLARLYDDCGYLSEIGTAIGRPDVYYAYGIPLYVRFGLINWFHLSNVLPLMNRSGLPLSPVERLKFHLLGNRIRRGLALADIVSAESGHSVSLLPAPSDADRLLSVNGSDDVLHCIESAGGRPKDDIATVLGTCRYKGLAESWQVFEMLRRSHHDLRLVIIGNATTIPRWLRRRPEVEVRGSLPREAVIDCLARTRFYISTTYAENSYNAASEGVLLADESYISDIPPHRELLSRSCFGRIGLRGVGLPLLHVQRRDFSTATLRTWDQVLTEMMATLQHAVPRAVPAAKTPAEARSDGTRFRRSTPTPPYVPPSRSSHDY